MSWVKVNVSISDFVALINVIPQFVQTRTKICIRFTFRVRQHLLPAFSYGRTRHLRDGTNESHAYGTLLRPYQVFNLFRLKTDIANGRI